MITTDTQQTIIITRGLPASGKSTWAKEIVSTDASWKRINKDDLRTMVHGGKWSRETERDIISARNALIRAFLADGKNVIVDDTNIEDKHIKDIFHIVASEFPHVSIEVKNFLTPLRECIDRDANREASVGDDVIINMAKRFDTTPRALEAWKSLYDYKYPVHFDERDEKLPNCIIIDIDGTVAKMYGRSAFDWDQVHTDHPNEDVINVIFPLIASFDSEIDVIIFMSGRDEVSREKTESWINNNVCSFEYELYMRTAGDMRKDYIVKRELYEKHIRGKFNPVAVFDDRNQVVHMWRKQLGLTVLQVADGNF